ncbi:elongation factor Ts [Candidatus Marinamargulisbacteria bacterium SCGC AG-343-D04]|nr:elongation factor Ts [Candidatus Marinamargulisbacteria bacterium SCGC AG-343-D04]
MSCFYKLSILFFLTILFSCSVRDVDVLPGARYRVTFTSNWSEDTHPVNFPSNPHFSGLVGTTHKEGVFFFSVGNNASVGIESMAETGSKALFLSELSSSDDTQYELSGSGLSTSPSSVTLDFFISSSYPSVTLVSMLAPSPDWFVGVSDLRLIENGDWVQSKTVTLNVYDAGSDNGIMFTSSNSDTSPKEAVSLLDSSSLDTDFSSGEPAIGTFYFEKL